MRRAAALAAACPKTECHLHLDGSVPPSFLIERAAARGVACPGTAPELRKMLHEMKDAARRESDANPQRPGSNWGVFDWCNQFLQTSDDLCAASRAIFDGCAAERVVHAELRFCPTLHTLGGLAPREALDAVVRGARESACPSTPFSQKLPYL